MKIQPLSALVGAASLGVALLTVSAFQVSVAKKPTQQLLAGLGITIDGPVQIEGVPTPSQMMRIVEGSPFTVPPGKVFVVTGTAFSSGAFGPSDVNVLFDGVSVLNVDGNTGSPTGGASAIPPGVVASEGTVVSVSSVGTGVLLGYLADA